MWHCHKYLSSDVKVSKQVEVQTQHGQFRLDFVLYSINEKIAVECDGRDFHDVFRDEFRDAILLGEEHISTIYHFRGCDLTYHPDDCIWLMSFIDSGFFSKRGHIHLNQLRNINLNGISHMVELGNFTSGGDDDYFFHAFRRTIHDKRGFWRTLYAFACEHPGFTLDELLTMYWSKEK